MPVCRLAIYAIEHWHLSSNRHFGALVFNSTSLAIATGVMATMIAWGLAYLKRLNPSPLNYGLIRLSTLGYALPGILLALAILDASGTLAQWWPAGARWILSGGIALLLYAYVCRFLTVAYQSVDAGFSGISPDIDAAAQNLGCRTESGTVAHSFTTAATQHPRCQPARVRRCHARAPRDTDLAALQLSTPSPRAFIDWQAMSAWPMPRYPRS